MTASPKNQAPKMRMKQIFSILLLFIVIGISGGKASGKQRIISIKSFGAKGDGISNDHEAFEKASAYINKAGQQITLLIPYGTYIVGKQTAGAEWLLDGHNVMKLTNCNDIEIQGEKRNGRYSKIKYRNGLYYGSFYPGKGQSLKPKCAPGSDYYNKKTCASIGTCFNIDQCNTVSISNIEIDGNQEGMIIGGNYGDKGIQINHRGLHLSNSKDAKLENIFVHHLGLDGIEVAGSTNTQLKNVASLYNGRQAMSWTDGNRLKANNCQFSYSGYGRIGSAPGSGLDSEPERGNDISDGQFTDCEFMYNSGVGLVNDRNSNLVSNIIFQRCTFLGYSNWAISMSGTRVKFIDCNIYGHCTHMVNNNDVKSPEDITLFKKCTFSNVYKNRLCKKISPFMLEFNNEKVRFEDCIIRSFDVGFLWYQNNDRQKGLESSMKGTSIATNNTNNLHAAAEGLLMENCTTRMTEKINYNLAASSENNVLKLLPKSALDIEMKSATILPYVNLINPYICTEK